MALIPAGSLIQRIPVISALIRSGSTLCVCLLLSACQPDTPEAMLQDYTDRLSNVLDQDSALDLSDLHPTPLPRRRLRLVTEQIVTQGLLEVLELHQCKLLPLIAQRNSSLGRVMQPSQQLIYELKFIDLLKACVEHPDFASLDKEPRDQLLAIWQIKSSNLPAVLWNGLYNNPAMEANFSASEPALELPGDAAEQQNFSARFATTRQALQHFAQLAGLKQPDIHWQLPGYIEALEADYQSLSANRFGSRWQRSLILLTATLNQAAEMIEKRLQRKAFCHPGHNSPKATTLFNVFEKYYAGRLQPYIARIHQQGDVWLEQHEAILTHLDAILPATMQSYRQLHLQRSNPEGQWQQYRQALQRHTQAWQQILQQCGKMPGGT